MESKDESRIGAILDDDQNAPADGAPPPASGSTRPAASAPAPRLRRVAAAAVAGVATAYVVVATFPMRYHSLNVDLDPGWQWGINFGSAKHLLFGRDVNFTYGPLGYLLVPFDIGSNLVIALAFWTAVQLIFAALIWRRFQMTRNAVSVAGFAGAYVFGSFLGFQHDYHLMIVLGLLLLHTLDAPRKEAIAAAVLAAAMTGAAPFMKFTFGVAAAAMLGVTAIVWALRRRKDARLLLATAASVYSAIAALVVVTYVGSLASFELWLRTSLDISTGYSVAMSSGPTPPILRGGALGLGVVACAVAAAAVARMRGHLTSLAVLSPAVYVAFKHSFTRHGGRYFLPFVILALSVLLLGSRRWKELALGAGALAIVAGALVPVACAYEGKTGCGGLTMRNLTGLAGAERVLDSLTLGRTRAELAELSATKLRGDRLSPAMLAPIEQTGGTVDVMPWEVPIIPANDLVWSPNPILQTYQAYTPYLDRRSARHLLGPDPPTFLVVKYATVNNRHFFLDQEATWKAVFHNYAPVAEDTSRHMVLMRSLGITYGPSYHAIGGARGTVDEWLAVPPTDPDERLFARVSMRMTRAGRLRTLLYRTEATYIDLRYENGQTLTYRIVPETMANGMLIGRVPRGAREAMMFLQGWRPFRVVAFRIHGAGAASYERTFDVTWERPAA